MTKFEEHPAVRLLVVAGIFLTPITAIVLLTRGSADVRDDIGDSPGGGGGRGGRAELETRISVLEAKLDLVLAGLEITTGIATEAGR